MIRDSCDLADGDAMYILALLTLLSTPLGQASESKQGLHAHLEATRGYYGDTPFHGARFSVTSSVYQTVIRQLTEIRLCRQYKR